MSEYTKQEAATLEAEGVAVSLRRAGTAVAAVMVLAGVGAAVSAVLALIGPQTDTGALVSRFAFILSALTALVFFIGAWWISAFSAAIAHLVKPRF